MRQRLKVAVAVLASAALSAAQTIADIRSLTVVADGKYCVDFSPYVAGYGGSTSEIQSLGVAPYDGAAPRLPVHQLKSHDCATSACRIICRAGR